MRAVTRLAISTSLLVAVSATCVGCTGGDAEDTNNPNAVSIPDVKAVADLPEGATAEAGVVSFCTAAPYEPWEWKAENGELTGFDIDTAEHTAKALGAKAQFVEVPYAEVATGDALTTDSCDVLVAAMPIDPVRNYTHRFTRTYLDTTHVLLAASGTDSAALTDFEGMALGVPHGSDAETLAREQFSEADIVALPDVTAIGDALAAGDISVGLADQGEAGYLARGRDDIDTVKTVGKTRSLGMAVSPDNESLATTLNTALDHLEDQGVSSALAKKWFGEI